MTDTLPSGGNDAAAPATFAEAFAADVSPTSDSPRATDTDAPPAAVAPDPSAPGAGPVASDDERSPYIPRSRFDEVNTKAKELREWRERHAWADGLDPYRLQQMAEWWQRAQTDTRGFSLGLVDELLSHPEHGPAMRSEIARRLSTRGASPSSTEGMPAPDVEITGPDGQVVGRTYSDKQLLKRDAYLEQQVLSKISEQFGTKFKTLDTIEQERQTQALQMHAQQFGTSFTQELSHLPLFTEHKAEIGQALAGLTLTSDHPDAVRAATYQLYHKIVGPKLAQRASQDTVADLQRKAHASTAVNPSSAAPATKKPITSFHDLPAEAWR